MSNNDYTMANFGALQQAESNFQSAYSGLQSQLSDLETSLQRDLAEWTGAAQQAYWNYKSQWDQAAGNCALILQNLHGVIGDAHTNYSTAEQYNSRLWNG
jgi:6 kDa early secretory antigenic target